MRKSPLVLTALAIVAVTATVLLRQRAPSSSWPRKAVTLIVPASAGIALDTNARLFGDRLSQRWGQPVIIDNRPAGDGILGFSIFAAKRDNHTLLFGITPPITMDAML